MKSFWPSGTSLRLLERYEIWPPKGLEEAQSAVRFARFLVFFAAIRYDPFLAQSLFYLEHHLEKVSRISEAATVAEEAVLLCRRQIRRDPRRFGPNLVPALSNWGRLLVRLDRREDAISVFEECVQIQRQGIGNAMPNEICLAVSLGIIGDLLSRLKRHEKALSVTEESVAIYRKLAEVEPEKYEDKLCGQLFNLSVTLTELGRQPEARAAYAEARELSVRPVKNT